MTSTILAMHEHGNWGGHPWWPLAWLLFWGAVLTAVWWVRRHRSPRPDARAVLSRRYAEGDIDDDEYRHRLAVLAERSR